MKLVYRQLRICLLLVLCLGLFPSQVFAYLDPGSGSYMIQMLIAAFIGILYSVKVFWHRIVAFVKKVFSSDSKSKKDN